MEAADPEPVSGLPAPPGGSDRTGVLRSGFRAEFAVHGPADGIYYGRPSPRGDGG